MVFSSAIFLFFFLPIVLVLYYTAQKRYRNAILLAGSILFYAWGEPKYVLLMLLSIGINYVMALLVVFLKNNHIRLSKLVLAADITVNLFLLFYFKYLDFTIRFVNRLFHMEWVQKNIPLPIGISFFTFQAMSYVIDCYRGDGKVQKNPVNVALYISLFPQLIAGPIVRYQTISEQLNMRTETKELFLSGIHRFMIGASKKCLLANSYAYIADIAFGRVADLSVVTAWVGAAVYTLQIYFDFSGYSDMAIGLGKMFGFQFLENFEYPYVSKSITEFWRRWHISLSTWFRDYIYIPLGGNRKGAARQFWNMGIVWLLTGIWHGANWTFICWGLYYGILLIAEKRFWYRHLEKSRILGHVYCMILVMVGWVFFRADSLLAACEYLKKMFGIGAELFSMDQVWYQVIEYRSYVFTGFVAALPLFPKIVSLLELVQWQERGWKTAIVYMFYILIGVLVITSVLNNSYNPFIYFNF